MIKRAYSKKGIVDWELEYSEAIRAKTKEAVSDIFDACDQIEKSEIAFGSIQDYKQPPQLAPATSQSIINIDFPTQP